MAARRYEITEFEAQAWARVIDAVEPKRFLSFLSYHIATSNFAPTPADASRLLELVGTADAAYARLERLIQSCGPYRNPDIKDPVVITTIQILGGWPAVNEALPAATEAHAQRRFRERFDAAFNEATVQVRINQQMPSHALAAIGCSPELLQLGRSVGLASLAAPGLDHSGNSDSRSQRFSADASLPIREQRVRSE